MPEATNPKFSETDVTFLLHENCGWGDVNMFPSSVYVEHECDRENLYEEAGRTFYDRTHLRYVPERTCKPVVVDIEEPSWGYIVECSECRHTFGGVFTSKEAADRFASALPVYYLQYCAKCGAKVMPDSACEEER